MAAGLYTRRHGADDREVGQLRDLVIGDEVPKGDAYLLHFVGLELALEFDLDRKRYLVIPTSLLSVSGLGADRRNRDLASVDEGARVVKLAKNRLIVSCPPRWLLPSTASPWKPTMTIGDAPPPRRKSMPIRKEMRIGKCRSSALSVWRGFML